MGSELGFVTDLDGRHNRFSVSWVPLASTFTIAFPAISPSLAQVDVTVFRGLSIGFYMISPHFPGGFPRKAMKIHEDI